ncbi:hypothetical protein LTR37_004264 [Vermiconidia calcicola]|uniref:Uncharacterized protein n=1 Tax=Vermiconidia calcicola TaxID=1690605 RepID=A0ACC3NP61_9PEZI|nr:hypothetical protein LTR37_004264 [Vermiconidia calcicola]
METFHTTPTVLNVPELLEIVLLHLSAKDLLLSQRVARLWRRTVQRSKSLRQTLFLEHVEPTTAWVLQRGDSEVVRAGPFSLGSKIVRELPAEDIHKVQVPDQTGYSYKAIWNDLLLRPGHWRHLSLDDRAQNGEGACLVKFSATAPDAARAMFLTHPPCTHLLLWLNWGEPEEISKPNGIRLGDVLRKVEAAPRTPYLREVFMRLKGVVCPTKADEKEMRERFVTNAYRRGIST